MLAGKSCCWPPLLDADSYCATVQSVLSLSHWQQSQLVHEFAASCMQRSQLLAQKQRLLARHGHEVRPESVTLRIARDLAGTEQLLGLILGPARHF